MIVRSTSAGTQAFVHPPIDSVGSLETALLEDATITMYHPEVRPFDVKY